MDRCTPEHGWSSRFAAACPLLSDSLPSRALLNDINPHAINFYRWLKKGLRIDREMRNESGAYYAARDRLQ